MGKWNTEASMFVEIFAPNQDSSFWTDDSGADLSESIDTELKRLIPAPMTTKIYSLEITFRSKGYYDKGVISGPPEKCYPPEGEDERTVTFVNVLCDDVYVTDGSSIITDSTLPETNFDAVYEQWKNEIEDADIDTDEDDDYYDDYGDDDFVR